MSTANLVELMWSADKQCCFPAPGSGERGERIGRRDRQSALGEEEGLPDRMAIDLI